MDAEIKAKWVAALRSGEYQQGDRQLRDGDRYCCLGVLCEVADLGITPEGKLPLKGGSYRIFDEMVGSRSKSMFLWVMNDRGESFAEIADWIEANL